MNIKTRSVAGYIGVGLVSLSLATFAGDMDKKGSMNEKKAMDTMMMEKDKMETTTMDEKMMDEKMEPETMDEKMMGDKMMEKESMDHGMKKGM